MKRFKSKDVKYKDEINERENNLASAKKTPSTVYASTNVEKIAADVTEKEAVENVVFDELSVEKVNIGLESQLKVKDSYIDYAKNYRINKEKTIFSEALINNLNSGNVAKANQVDDVVLAILCVFIPPLAVYLYEDSITTNFWVDLIATLLFWLPGMILAFLIVFGGFSF